MQPTAQNPTKAGSNDHPSTAPTHHSSSASSTNTLSQKSLSIASTSQQNDSKSLQKHHSVIKHFTRSLLLTPWLAEIFSCLLSAIALASIIAIAHSRNRKPLPNWYFSVNFLVSTFSSLFKAALLLPVSEAIGELKWLWFADSRVINDVEDFDLASRGPRGSLAFLFRLPKNKLACLGALVTVLAIGSDPLTQLVIQNYDCFEERENEAFIYRTNNYTAFGQSSNTWWMLDAPMSLALYQGTLKPPASSTSDLPVECSTSNCTFKGKYSSLEMCYSVSNFSEKSGQVLAAYPEQDGAVLSTEQTTTANETEGSPLFQFKAEARSWTEYSKSWSFKAALHPCVKTYGDVNISSSRLEQKLLSTTNLVRIPWGKLPYYSLIGEFSSFGDTNCTPSSAQDERKTTPTKKLKNGTPFIPPPAWVVGYTNWSDASLVASQDQMWYEPACAWHLGMGPTQALPATLGEGMFGKPGKPNILKASGGMIGGDLWLKNLYADGYPNVSAVEAYMEGLANSITAQMRRNGDGNYSLPLQGTLKIARTCLRFDWHWLIWDVVLLVETVILLAATAWRVRRRQGPKNQKPARGPWKSSALPLLWCGLEDPLRAQRGELNDLKEIRETGETVKVKLMRVFDEVTVDQSSEDNKLVSTEQSTDGTPQDELDDASDLEANADTQLRGRWALVKQEDLSVPEKPKVVRRIGFNLSSYIPIG